MAKIAVVFLLFAIVAVCNGARVPREEPQPPQVGVDFKPVIEQFQKLASDKNVEGLKAEIAKVGENLQKSGSEAWAKLLAFGKDLEEVVKKNLPEAPKA
ncbi:neuropeptide-like 2 [Drosophila sulfurigaster albostrigata]|uniref:neuropeptide-like 2 n=1 Tax=Drosophila nasuta TaxID=42062 RepID=UPI00295F0FD8|nr:neuropeptide-like 2 [Drosophila nasuta]XP_062131903.1 neuropeptide-like 2 [Drosophila sulfurigaster albostrigata]